jgi:PPOX class probable FMN-dependent enzyme
MKRYAAMKPFADTLDTLEELRSVYTLAPTPRSLAKEMDHFDRHIRAYIAHAPFVVVATSSEEGLCEASPRGGAPGWVKVLDDHRLLIPDNRGNNRLDAITNIVQTGQIALLFLVPGRTDTLRVNGEAWITTDQTLLGDAPLDGKVCPAGIGVRMRTAYMQCAKALMRSQIWEPDAWPDLDGLARPAEISRDHAAPDATVEQIEASLQESYTQRYTW